MDFGFGLSFVTSRPVGHTVVFSVSTIIGIGVSLSSPHIMDSVGISTIGDSPS